jgi:hypothetical protein
LGQAGHGWVINRLREEGQAAFLPAVGIIFASGSAPFSLYIEGTMKMKTLLGFALVAIAFATGLAPHPSLGQAGGDDPLLSPLIEEITKQQAVIVENQTQIDAKLATIAEDIRVARIFVGRGGGKAIGK